MTAAAQRWENPNNNYQRLLTGRRNRAVRVRGQNHLEKKPVVKFSSFALNRAASSRSETIEKLLREIELQNRKLETEKLQVITELAEQKKLYLESISRLVLETHYASFNARHKIIERDFRYINGTVLRSRATTLVDPFNDRLALNTDSIHSVLSEYKFAIYAVIGFLIISIGSFSASIVKNGFSEPEVLYSVVLAGILSLILAAPIIKLLKK